jgi:hypothetical protein
MPDELLKMLIYVIYTEMATALANHALKFSRFSCQVVEDAWVASITLGYWRVGSNGPCVDAKTAGATALVDDEPIYPPIQLKEVWKRNLDDHRLSIEPEVSTIVMSTNPV